MLDLSEPINEYVPGVPPEVRIADCLSHSSGYPNWRPFYAQHLRAIERWGSSEIRNSVFRSAAQTPLVGDPGTSYAYSDIGFSCCVHMPSADLASHCICYGSKTFQSLQRMDCTGATPMQPQRKIVLFGGRS